MHVTNGDCTVETLEATGLGGDVIGWRDALEEGPAPKVGAGELRAVRARFLADCGWGAAAELEEELRMRDETLRDALEHRHVVLWFEHDLCDQLQLLQILAFADEVGYEPTRLELIVIGAFEGRPEFKGLGELDVEELASLSPSRMPVTAAQTQLARRAWQAFRDADPRAIETLLAGDTGALPFLAPALRRLLEELPDTRTGLGRSEHQLLAPLLDGPRTPVELFHAAQAAEEAPFDADASVWRRLAELGVGRDPLVTASGDPLPTPPPRGDQRTFTSTAVALTETGRRVLEGAVDRVVAGSDRWLGGVHLTPESRFRWDADAGRVAMA